MFEQREIYRDIKEHKMKYLVNLPNDCEDKDNKKWPLMLFLHGAGERGDNLDDIKKYGVHRYLERKDIPFVVVSPQCPKDTFWDIHIKDLISIIKEVKTKYSIDDKKIYLVGISMGGHCAWNFAMQYPKLFAAVMPIAGGPMLSNYAERIKDIPIWTIHGKKDKVVSVEKSREIVFELQQLNGNIKYTEDSNSGHEICTTIFEKEEIYEWLLNQSK
ncbi:alpha/beta fold hydrolase [Dethiothermospora halolimnae]|uniref:carboxylesterase family protein n=1 Tax=Dethiothermospora halolimnae TaxID=3114390 RepID=UPI003CCBC1F5